MRHMWERIRNALTGGIKQRVTRLGLFFTALTLLVGLAAFASANNLLFLLLAAMLATLLISGFVSRLGLAGLEVDLELPEHISARVPVAGQIRIHNDKFWMPSFSLTLSGTSDSGFADTVYFPVIPGGARIEQSLQVCFRHRGQYREDTFIFGTRFPFGFTERQIHVPITRDVIVYPCILEQPGFAQVLAGVEGEIAARFRGRSDDFYRIRPYEHHESARHVDWKATAHTGALQVREFSRQEDPCVEVFLDLAGTDAAWLERAVDCCAYLVWNLAASNRRVVLHSQAGVFRYPEQVDAYTILKFLALAGLRPGADAPAPDDPANPQVVLTRAAQQAADAGWSAERVVGDALLGADDTTPAAKG